ncbi:MAG: prepilin-type N-terminal cleavage/methylation domain-containing protein [Candidatus Marinimicrobia bacterium]|nr:prepilin-type N-terminal cleavage/methylation domain-containing protein [Candidatus Neomarinimicrobiota bacterium]
MRSKIGFTLIEVIIAILITGVMSFAIFSGITFVKGTLRTIRIKERAFEELVSYTEFWKAKIAADQIPSNIGSDDKKEVVLFENENGLPIVTAKLKRSNLVNLTNPSGSSARHYRMKTEIEWNDETFGHHNNQDNHIEFTISQLVFIQ